VSDGPGADRPVARTPLDDEVAARIRRRGPIPFAEVMDLALYDPQHGFYAAGGGAGRRGDFLTSPEVGPLFGAVVARALDGWWEEAGRPDPFVVVEAAAGNGMLARTILGAGPVCADLLTYVLVERSAALRARHDEHLELVAPELAFPPELDPDRDAPGDAGRAVEASAATGPRVVSLGSLPAFPCADVVLANELLDNLPVVLLEATGDGDRNWAEVRVALGADDRSLVELLVPAAPALAARARRLVPDAVPGSRIPLATTAADWLRQALDTVRHGRVVLLDYADDTPALARRPVHEWLRTYRGHERGLDPLAAIGTQDITCEVPVDQLDALMPIDRNESQAAFLARHGIEELVEEGRRTWTERAHIGDLEAVRGRSRIREAEALMDPEGLGAFRVLEWHPRGEPRPSGPVGPSVVSA